jgi:hypothetical protein
MIITINDELERERGGGGGGLGEVYALDSLHDMLTTYVKHTIGTS